ncbi:unnamed protein product [Adineta steineri]|uniref:Uncharacterized protein n=1 Tax=Adineta steineri TaxID=433720 RepID=A0A815MX08_9BILA|nr:unnamed protein product [Adineta steineri]CAF4011427.1 unnamed protein product [Adineta steineri]
MLIDTEGLFSSEKGDEEYDRRLILFCLAMSHLVIINVAGEIDMNLKKMLILCTDSFQKMGVSKIARPSVHVILNRRDNVNVEDNSSVIQIIKKDLNSDSLDQQIELNENTFHALPQAFKKISLGDTINMPSLLQTDPTFINMAQDLCEKLIEAGIKTSKEHNKELFDPIQWLSMADTVLDILRKFPDMTYFNDIHERKQYDSIREWIRDELKKTFTGDLRKKLLARALKEDEIGIKSIFTNEFARLKLSLMNELEKKLTNEKATKDVRKRCKTFLEVQIDSLQCCWTDSALMDKESNELKKLIETGENQLNKTIRDTIEAVLGNQCDKLQQLVPNVDQQFLNDLKGENRRRVQAIAQNAGDIFDKIWNNAYPRLTAGFNHDTQCKSASKFVYGSYNIFEKSNLPDFTSVMPFLTIITHNIDEQSKDASNASESESSPNNEQIFDEIQKACIHNMSKHPLLEEHQFQNRTLSTYTRDTIETFKYLNVQTLLDKYDRYHSKGTTDRWSPDFHLHLKRCIVECDLTSEHFLSSTGTCRTFWNIKKSFDELLDDIRGKIILSGDDSRVVDIELVQELVGVVLTHIDKIDSELETFNLSASKHYLGAIHTYSVLILTKFYYDEQWHSFEQLLQKVQQKKDDLRAYFIAMVTQDQQSDPRFAAVLANSIFTTVSQYCETEGAKKIHDRTADKSAFTQPSLLKKINSQIEEDLDKLRTDCDLILKWFTDKLDQSSNCGIDGFRKMTFINDIFTASNSSDNLSLINKGRCMSLLLRAQFKREHPIPKQIPVSRIIYSLTKKGENMVEELQKCFSKIPYPGEVPIIIEMMKDKFDFIYILNLHNFITSCKEELLGIRSKNQGQFSSATQSLNRLCWRIKETMLRRHCKATCCCCGSLCNADHEAFNNACVWV